MRSIPVDVNAFLPILTDATTPISIGIMSSTYFRFDGGEGSVKVDMLSPFILRLNYEELKSLSCPGCSFLRKTEAFWLISM